MPANTVNLDALIPREDFASEAEQAGGSPRTTISLTDLGNRASFRPTSESRIFTEKRRIGRPLRS